MQVKVHPKRSTLICKTSLLSFDKFAAGCDKTGPVKGCIDELPNPGTAADILCHASFYALLSLLYATDLIWQVETVYCIGQLASKALIEGNPLKLDSG